MIDYPRVLVVNYDPINRERNNGMTMAGLFAGWPTDRLATAYLSPLVPDLAICPEVWHFRRDLVRQLRRTAGPVHSGPADGSRPSVAIAAATPRRIRERVPGYRLLRAAAMPFGEPVRELFYRNPGILGPGFRAWAQAVRPELVYSMMGTGMMTRLAVRVAELLGVPFVPHFTDDWLTTQYLSAKGSRWLRRSMEEWVRRGLRRAPVRLAISDAMSAEYRRRFGGPFETFLHCVDPDAYPVTCEPEPDSQGVRFLYVGGLHLRRWEGLVRIAEVLDELRAHGLRGHLRVLTMPNDVPLLRPYASRISSLDVGGWVPHDSLPAEYRAAHVLVHVESFDRSISRYTKYSLSTKIPEYLMAGRPLLAFGPREVASVDYIANSGAGVVVGDNSGEALRRELTPLIGNAGDRRRRAAIAREVGLSRHSRQRESERFRLALCEAVAGGPRSDHVGLS